jgi:HSP20 family molecular chaperone IbpA
MKVHFVEPDELAELWFEIDDRTAVAELLEPIPITSGETDRDVQITMTLPRFSTADVFVSTDANRVVVRGKRILQTFDLREPIDPAHASAEIETGRIRLTFPKLYPTHRRVSRAA